ncbi:hypothetical protein E4U61_001473 [Claviceps capensis]|nr:hypothetical protein E4U61_001473 [Claviceps capensis]
MGQRCCEQVANKSNEEAGVKDGGLLWRGLTENGERGDNEPQLSYGQHLAGTDKELTGTGVAFTPTKKAIYDLIVVSDIVSHITAWCRLQLVTALHISWHRPAALGGPYHAQAAPARQRRVRDSRANSCQVSTCLNADRPLTEEAACGMSESSAQRPRVSLHF